MKKNEKEFEEILIKKVAENLDYWREIKEIYR